MTGKPEEKTGKARHFIRKSQEKIAQLRNRLAEFSTKKREAEEERIVLAKTLSAPKEVKVTISLASVVKATIAIFLLMALVNVLGILKSVLIIFLVALFLSATFNPAVDKLHQFKIPRGIGIILIYLVVIGVFVIIFSNLIPIIAEQIGQIAGSVKDIIQNLVSGEGGDSWLFQQIQPYVDQIWQNVDQAQLVSSATDTLSQVASGLGGFANNAIGAIFSVFNGIFNLLLVLMITFFMVVYTHDTNSFFQSLFPHRYANYITQKMKEISGSLGEWVRGQVLLAIAMGVLTFTIFSIIGLEYALTLAFVSAIAEFIPYLGPVITFGSAALIGFNQEPGMIWWLIPAYAVIQFVESNILAPLIVGKAVGLNPIVIIFSLMSGASIGYWVGEGSIGLGIVGMIVAVPIANIISIFVEDYTEKNK